jgi:hypothetical protein
LFAVVVKMEKFSGEGAAQGLEIYGCFVRGLRSWQLMIEGKHFSV